MSRSGRCRRRHCGRFCLKTVFHSSQSRTSQSNSVQQSASSSCGKHSKAEKKRNTSSSKVPDVMRSRLKQISCLKDNRPQLQWRWSCGRHLQNFEPPNYTDIPFSGLIDVPGMPIFFTFYHRFKPITTDHHGSPPTKVSVKQPILINSDTFFSCTQLPFFLPRFEIELNETYCLHQ